MEVIWASSEKEKDGCLHYPPPLIDFLWDNGFVDTEKFNPEEWRQAFEAFKQKDGNYKISHDEFMTLDKYRYDGPIRIPFDPEKINEGKYTDEGFGQLVQSSIAPSCGLPPSELKQCIDDLKQEFRQDDDLVLIKAAAKQKIKKLLDEFPSPLRRLEIIFDRMMRSAGKQKEIETLDQATQMTATPEQAAAIQKSTFSAGALSVAETKAKALREITQAQSKEEPPANGGGEELKSIKRSKKGLRG